VEVATSGSAVAVNEKNDIIFSFNWCSAGMHRGERNKISFPL